MKILKFLLRNFAFAQSTIITDEASGEYGKPFSTELFARKDYSKELNSGIFSIKFHFTEAIENGAPEYHQNDTITENPVTTSSVEATSVPTTSVTTTSITTTSTSESSTTAASAISSDDKTLILMMMAMQDVLNGTSTDTDQMLPLLLFGDGKIDMKTFLLMTTMMQNNCENKNRQIDVLLPLILRFEGGDDNYLLYIFLATRPQALGASEILPLLMMDSDNNNQELFMFMTMMNNQYCTQ